MALVLGHIVMKFMPHSIRKCRIPLSLIQRNNSFRPFRGDPSHTDICDGVGAWHSRLLVGTRCCHRGQN